MKTALLLSTLAVTLVNATPLFAQSSTSTHSPAFGYPSYGDGQQRGPAQSSTSTHSPAFGYPSYDDGQQSHR
jgi:hypothetical protein